MFDRVVEKICKVLTLPLSKSYFSFRYLRMSPQLLEHLLKMVGPVIQKDDTTFRKSISAEQRLLVTLHFLAMSVGVA